MANASGVQKDIQRYHCVIRLDSTHFVPTDKPDRITAITSNQSSVPSVVNQPVAGAKADEAKALLYAQLFGTATSLIANHANLRATHSSLSSFALSISYKLTLLRSATTAIFDTPFLNSLPVFDYLYRLHSYIQVLPWIITIQSIHDIGCNGTGKEIV